MQVLDASAVLALLLQEPGNEVAGDALRDGVVSVVNFAEAAAVLARRGGTPAETQGPLALISGHVIPADIDQALAAGLMETVTRAIGLSLGDRFCLALARRLGATAVTADRAWLGIADAVGVEVRLIR